MAEAAKLKEKSKGRKARIIARAVIERGLLDFVAGL
jgi:hypothetical protein